MILCALCKPHYLLFVMGEVSFYLHSVHACLKEAHLVVKSYCYSALGSHLLITVL